MQASKIPFLVESHKMYLKHAMMSYNKIVTCDLLLNIVRDPVPRVLLGVAHVGTFCFSSAQFSSVAQSCPTLCDPMNCCTSGLPVHHQLPEFTQTHAHQVGDAIQPSHPVVPFSCPQSVPASGSFPMSQLFASGGQSIGVQLQHHPSNEHPGLISFRMD